MDVSAKVAHSGEGEAAGARMPPWPHLSDAAVHRAKQGRNCWSGQWQRKMALLCQRHIKIQQAAESPWPCPFFFLPFGPWAAKSGCGRQPAKRVWLPTASQTLCLLHPWVGEINFAGQAGNGVTGALRTARGSTLGLSCISRIFRRAIFHKDANNGPNPAYTCWEGQGRPPLPASGHTAAHRGKRERNRQGRHDREKKNPSLSQHLKTRQAARPVPDLPLELRPAYNMVAYLYLLTHKPTLLWYDNKQHISILGVTARRHRACARRLLALIGE